MATFTKTYTFVGATNAVSGQVNQNFDDVGTFLNNSVAHVDGSKAFTGIPVLPAVDPTSANQATRKQYVDNAIAALGGAWTTYVPVVTQGGVVAATASYAKYMKFGKTCVVAGLIVPTGSGTLNNPIEVSLPFDASTANIFLGKGQLFNGSTLYPSMVGPISSVSKIRFRQEDAPHTNLFQGQTGSTWGNAAINSSHSLGYQLTYETV